MSGRDYRPCVRWLQATSHLEQYGPKAAPSIPVLVIDEGADYYLGTSVDDLVAGMQHYTRFQPLSHWPKHTWHEKKEEEEHHDAAADTATTREN